MKECNQYDNWCEKEKRSCNNCYYEPKKYEITVPLITNEEIEKIGKTYNLYIEEVVKAVTHDKEMIILHTIIKEQKRRMDEIKELIKYASDCDSPTLGKILRVLEE